MRATRPDKPTVVVVGEAKRGKSSLTNALINVAGLSPVDARVATSTYIMFRRGPQTAARALLPGQDQPVEVPLDRLRHWATDLGDRGEFAPPRLIEVECNSPLLGKLNLVDTPGVGGLDASHADIALRAVGRATALLFVCDASAPFTKPEVDFLVRASRNIDLVIFAVTKIDAYRGWRQIVEDNRKLLREHAPRFADSVMLPVSSKLFEQAAVMGASELSKALRQESKITDLQIALQQQVAIKASALHEANLLRTIRSQLDGLKTQLEDSRRACQPDVEYANRLKENRDRLLQARKADSRAWQLRLRSLLSRARLDTMADIQSEQRRFLSYWRKQIEEVDKSKLQLIGPALDAALKASSMQIFDRQQARLRNVSQSVLQSMFAQNELAEVHAALQRPRTIATAAGPNQRTMTTDEKVMTGMGLVSAISLGKLAAMPIEGALAGALGIATGTASLILLPVVLGVGIGAAGWMVWARRTAADRNNLKVWLNETLGETRARLEADASAFFIEAEQELTLALDRALLRRIETLDGHIKQIDQSLKVDRGERERRAAEITKQISTVREVSNTIDQILPRLRNAVVAKKTAPAKKTTAGKKAAPPGQEGTPVAAGSPEPQLDQVAAPTRPPTEPALPAAAAPPTPADTPAPQPPESGSARPPRAPSSVAHMAASAAARLAEKRVADRRAANPPAASPQNGKRSLYPPSGPPDEAPSTDPHPTKPRDGLPRPTAIPPVHRQFGAPFDTDHTSLSEPDRPDT